LKNQQKQQGGGAAKNDFKKGIQEVDSDQEDGIQRKNPNVNKNWKMPARKFKEILSPYTTKMPKLGNKTICAMYNIVGRCVFGNQCRHSHDELPEDVCVKINKWIKDCKEKADKRAQKKNGDKN
jgi:hypothetical protein